MSNRSRLFSTHTGVFFFCHVVLLFEPELDWLSPDPKHRTVGDRRAHVTEKLRKSCTDLPCRLAVPVLPFPLSLTVSVAVPLAVAVPFPAAFSVIVLMPVAAARFVASALFSGTAVVSFPGTLSPSRHREELLDCATMLETLVKYTHKYSRYMSENI